MSSLRLDERDRALLGGEAGEACRLAMEVVVEMAGVVGAEELIDIDGAHIDGCLPFGQVALDLPQRLLEGGGQVAVPTTLNVAAMDLLHPELPRGDPDTAALGRRIAAAYEALGCRPTWTCAPYQLSSRPAFGQHIAWAESNAIVFANSVLGARTSRYGDFFDICAALTGRVPRAGLHLTEQRAARAVFHVDGLPDDQLFDDLLFPLLGTLIGERAGSLVPAIVGLPAASEDQLKALGAAAASSGAVAMFHAVGITPEAPDLGAATQGAAPKLEIDVSREDLAAVRRRLGARSDQPLSAVALGTPHASLSEIAALRGLLDGRRVHPSVSLYASTSRETLAELGAHGWDRELAELGVTLLVDTCTYLRPMIDIGGGTVLTNSAKWAWYAPMTLGVDVVIGSIAECAASAIAGRMELDDAF